MTHLRRIALPAYIVSAMLILYPLMDLMQNVWPPRLGEAAWRVLVAGLLSRMMLTPALGLLFAYVTALLLEQPRVLRVQAVVNAFLAFAVLVGVGFFFLDALQTRTQVAPETKTNFTVGLAISFAKYGIGWIFLVALAFSEWRSGLRTSRAARQRSTPDSKRLIHSTDATPKAGATPSAPPEDAPQLNSV
jgi:hypothetical protein